MNYLLIFVAGLLLTVGTFICTHAGSGNTQWLYLFVASVIYAVGLLIGKRAAV